MPKIEKSNREKDFTQVFNQLVRDPRLSWKARGIFTYLYSLPSNWVFHESELQYHSWGDGLKSLRRGVKQLRFYKYIIIWKRRDKHGQILKNGTVWYLNDKPNNNYAHDIINAKHGLFPAEWKGHLTSLKGHEVKFLSNRGTHLTVPKGREVKSLSHRQSHLKSLSVGEGMRRSSKGQSTNTIYIPIRNYTNKQNRRSARTSKSNAVPLKRKPQSRDDLYERQQQSKQSAFDSRVDADTNMEKRCQDCGITTSPLMTHSLLKLQSVYGDSLLHYGMRYLALRGITNGFRFLSLLRACLRNWRQEGLSTPSDVAKHSYDYYRKKLQKNAEAKESPQDRQADKEADRWASLIDGASRDKQSND